VISEVTEEERAHRHHEASLGNKWRRFVVLEVQQAELRAGPGLIWAREKHNTSGTYISETNRKK
jgi:hypothetical protein